MSVADKLITLTTALTNYANALVTRINAKVPLAFNADNALRLGTKTASDFTTETQNLLAGHLGESNPHETTAEKINTYTIEQVQAMLGVKVGQGILPISLCRVSTDVMVRLSGSDWQVGTTDLEAMLSGRYLKDEGTIWRTIMPLVDGETYHLYLVMNGSLISFLVSQEIKPETETSMYLGTFNGPSVTTETIIPTFITGDGITRIDNYRVSSTARGHAIPVSSKNTAGPTSLIWK